MSKEPKELPPEAEDEDVEAHLIKEALVTGAAAASIFAGTAQAQFANPGGGSGGAVFVDPGTGVGGAQVGNPGGGATGAVNVDPGTGVGGAQVGNPGGGATGAANTDPGGGSATAARKSHAKKHAPAKSKVRKHQGSTHTNPPQKPPLQPEG